MTVDCICLCLFEQWSQVERVWQVQRLRQASSFVSFTLRATVS
jgi:hypothetical protein